MGKRPGYVFSLHFQDSNKPLWIRVILAAEKLASRKALYSVW